MLNILRKNAQSFVVQAIVVIIAIVFIFWGVGTNLDDNPNALAVVNGKEIPYRDFQQNYERAIENYKQQFGGQIPQGFLESMGLKEQVLDQLIQAELMRQGAEKVGIRISKEAVQRTIQDMAVFKSKGQFDFVNYKAILEQNKLTPSSFESGIHNDLLMDRIMKALGDFTVIPAQEVRNWTEYINQEIKLAYAVLKSENYIAQVVVTDEALAAWYETAKDKYKTPLQSKLHYFAFEFNDDLKEVAVSDEAVRTYYQQHMESFNTPEKRRARHILFKVDAESPPDVKAARKADAEKTLALLKKGGDFSRLARQFSEDATKEKGGDLGFFGRGQMVQPFEDTVFSLKKNELSGVVETPFGYHLIELNEIVPAKTQTLEEVSGTIRTMLERQGVKAITFKKASSAYEDIIKAGSLAKYSSAQGAHPVRQTDFFPKDAPPKNGMVGDPAFLQAAFSLRKGELSSIVETVSGYAILFVDDVKPSEVPELGSVRKQAAADYQKEKSVELARAAAEELLEKAKKNNGWPADLQRQETEYIGRGGPAGPIPDELRQDAFSRVGKEVFPDKTIIVGSSFYIYQIIDTRQRQEEMDADKRRNLEQQLHVAAKSKLIADWLGQLRKEANISSNAKMLQ